MWDRWARRATLAAVVSTTFSIFIAGLFFAGALLTALTGAVRSKNWRFRLPPFFPFVAAYLVFLGLSILFSDNIGVSLDYLRKSLRFLYILLIYHFLEPADIRPALHGIFAGVSASAAYGILQYFWLKNVTLTNRIDGFMGHWMTFSGQLMLTGIALSAFLLAERSFPRSWMGRRESNPGASGVDGFLDRAKNIFRRPLVWGGASAALIVWALVLAMTRSAWAGLLLGVVVVTICFRSRLLFLPPLAALLIFLLLPPQFKERAYAAFNPRDTTVQVRLELVKTGAKMAWAHPWFGLGPGMVPHEYSRYRVNRDFPGWIYQHLHNDALQVAAESGLFALAAWLGLWIFLLYDFMRMAGRARGGNRLVFQAAVGGIGIVAAFLCAGLFEYNFGDSEILILLLFFITMPYVALKDTATH